MKRQAISYLRYSSGKQKGGTSEERQERMLGEWLASHPDFELSPIQYKDLGRSGHDGSHLDNELGQLIAHIEEGHITSGSVLIVEAVDRIGRMEPMEMLPLFSRIIKAGISIITLDDQAEYTRESVNNEKLYLLVAKIQQAWQFSENLSRRLKAAWQGKRERAKRGEAIKKRLPIWFDKEGKLNELAPYIKQAFEDCATGLGNAAILRRLRQKDTAFNDYSVAGVRHWFEFDSPDAEIALGLWQGVETHPAVVDKELYYRAMQTRQANKNGKKAAPQKHYLTGLVVCGVCGGNFIYAGHGTKDKPQAPHYKCSNLQHLKCSNNKRVPVAILDAIRVVTYAPFLQQALEHQQLSKDRKAIIAIEGEISSISGKLSKLATLLVQLDDVEEIVIELASLKKKRDDLIAQKALLEQSPTRMMPDAEGWREKAAQAMDMRADAEKDRMRLNALLRQTDYRLVIHPPSEPDVRWCVSVGDRVWKYHNWIKKDRMYVCTRPDGDRLLVSSDWLYGDITLAMFGTN